MTNKSLYTPTPWYLEYGTNNVVGKNLCLVHSLDDASELSGGKETALANAKLIAAAPDLLEALQAVYAAFTKLSTNLERTVALISAEKAIARATNLEESV